MAILKNVTTKAAEKVWESDDGKIAIFKLTLDHEGTGLLAKTYSKQIATVGWSGDVESYEKAGRNGVETFVKQPAKEGFSGGGGRSGGRPLADPFTMYMAYAKDVVVAEIGAGRQDKYTDLIDDIIVGAYTLYDNRPEARAAKTTATTGWNNEPLPTAEDAPEELPL